MSESADRDKIAIFKWKCLSHCDGHSAVNTPEEVSKDW